MPRFYLIMKIVKLNNLKILFNINIVYIFIIFFLKILFTPSYIQAQDKEIASLIVSGDHAFAKNNYYGAAKLYEDALKYNKRMYDIVLKAADAYRLDNDYVNAAKHYRVLAEKQSEQYPIAIYYYAQMLKANEDFVKAQYFFNQYIRKFNFDTTQLLVKKSITELSNCELAWKLYNRPSGHKIIHCDTSINSVYSDFCTAFYNDSLLVFSSIRPNGDSVINYNSKIYFVNHNSTNNAAKLFNSTFNIPNADVANIQFNAKQDKAFFTITRKELKDSKLVTHIYYSSYQNNEWTKPEKLPELINKKNYNSTHPFLIERESKPNILLWSSDCAGGEGGYDIYQCEILFDGSFGLVRNVGRPIIEDKKFAAFYDTTSVINTKGNEVTPFYNQNDSCLYFSSNWHNSIGGYDIFKVKGNFRVWDTITNLGYPINSAQNDFYYKIYNKQAKAFLTSNRKSSLALSHQSCCNDLYYHEIEKEITEELIVENRIEIITEKTKLLVPIALYFHNDHPNPRTRDTLTTLTYSETYFNYINQQELFRKSFSKGLLKTDFDDAIDSVDYFFSYYVQDNYNKLLEFTTLMKELVISGQKVIITIKGYTSPLNTYEYNENLAKRRISSLVNFFEDYENGFFKPYISNAQITYEFVAFGKTLSAGKVSDDPNDPRNSIYSPAASRERRIEIIAVSVEKH